MSSKQWLSRQRLDQYVVRAAREGYRSRALCRRLECHSCLCLPLLTRRPTLRFGPTGAAYKLQQIHQKTKILHSGHVALELGASPGSWTQVLVKHGLRVVGVDLLPIEPIDGATLVQGDFTSPSVQATLQEALGEGGRCDVLLSDVSPNRSGNKSLDDAAISDYCTQSLELASRCLKPGGTFVCKLLQGAELQHTLERAKPLFKTSGGLMKPAASRPKSREIYLVAKGFDPEAYSNRLFW